MIGAPTSSCDDKLESSRAEPEFHFAAGFLVQEAADGSGEVGGIGGRCAWRHG
ncbi:hypothetical protein [Streptomyces sp. A1547]|uniref:hypothetical protein n=1 Tax=Streptomyces sp. A1547 TaxID=2563105 RepID=UPI00144A8CBE|nr:hypothetical protein [Streptomyces sp. A1547]